MSIPGFIRRNWRLKVVCFLIAFVTWVGVVYAGDPPETKVVQLPVPQSPSNIPAGFVLVHPVSNVLVRVGGDQSTLNSLNPAVLTVNVDWAAVTHAGTYSIPLSITNTDPDIELIDPPTSVQVDLDVFTSKSIPVSIQISSLPPVGYEYGSQQISPTTVVVEGPEHELAGLVARVTVNLSNQKANFQQQVPVLLYTNNGSVRLNAIGVTPNDVSVSIAITADVTKRIVAVVPKTIGSPSNGHYLIGIVYAPLTVVVTGPQDLLNSLDSLATVAIPLGGITGDYTETVAILAPAGVTLSATKVSVTIEMGSIPSPPTPTPSPTPTPTPGT
jgi:YbbR domain-containing protein